jgi:hypothetical protein
MKLSRVTSAAIVAAIIQCSMALPVVAGPERKVLPRWNVAVDQIDSGDSGIAPEFKVAIYESLLTELAKTKQFSAVLRSGDRDANALQSLLSLRTTVESFTPGSETKRAVTTVAGATKLRVRSQLCTRERQIVFERVVDGNVRFLGGNLRATHNLAHNVAHAIEKATLPELGRSNERK